MTPPRWPWQRLHAALMPDYNRKATVYWWVVVLTGAVTLGYSARHLFDLAPPAWLQFGLATGAAMLAGLVPVRTPRSTNSFTAGEIFIFLLLLLQGPETAALASALEALVGTLRTSKRWTSWIASPTMAAIAMFSCGTLLHWGLGALRLKGMDHEGFVLLGAVAFACAYFLVNTLLVTMVPRLKRNESLKWADFMSAFGWLAVVYSGNASIATFLYLNFGQAGIVGVVAAMPIIGVLLTTGHYFFRRQEAEHAVKEAARAEAERTAQHVVQLQRSEQRFHGAFTHASIGMALVGFDQNIRQANDVMYELLGVPAAQATDETLRGLLDDESTRAVDRMFAQVRAGQRAAAVEITCRQPDGAMVWLSVNCSAFADPDTGEPCFIVQSQDITTRKEAEAKLLHIAFHDDLTGLPNRQRFNEQLTRAIEDRRVDPTREFGVMFLDCDRFKVINDSLGHTLGDQFLVLMARRIEDCVRAGDVVARLGGDEFAILSRAKGARDAVIRLAERLLVDLARPYDVEGLQIATSVSIGLTFSSLGYSSPEEVLRDADTAMYKAKAAGKARYAEFDFSLHAEVAQRLRLEGDLRAAFDGRQLSLEYQPLIDLATGQLQGFEALARWDHPTLGRISPASFISVAEESGSIVMLTDFVLTTACNQLAAWQQSSPELVSLTMHINVSGNDLAKPGLCDRVARALLTARLHPECLTIELTENILMEQLAAAMDTLQRLNEIGVRLSVDDFGTGYSSLSHLSTLPIHSLKIDRSFVSGLEPDSKEAAVIQAIVSLGHSLGKGVVAEGIETPEQAHLLRDLNCDVGQGYHFSRPLPPEKVRDFLASRVAAEVGGGDAASVAANQLLTRLRQKN